jgi:glycosyltransferase involved in cell wall biosynthesis/GR25 family glycosyltransferase involved in LPS biosynthesis
MANQENNSKSLLDFWNGEKKNKQSTFLENIQESLETTIVYMNQFDWEKYYEAYPDIQGEHNELNAYKHWIELGIKENRCAGKKYSQEPFERFDYKSYAKLNPDLKDFNEIELYNHWMNHGIFENRPVTQVEDIKNPSNTVEKISVKSNVTIFKDKKKNEEWCQLLKTTLEELVWKDYLTRYADLVENGIKTQHEALLHWLCFGKDEGRSGNKPRLSKQTETSNQNLKKMVEEKKVEEKENIDETIAKLTNEQLKNTPMFIINLSERIDKKMEMKHQLKKIETQKYHIYRGYDKHDREVKSEFERYHRQYGRGKNNTTFYNSKTKCKVITAIGAVGLIKSTIELFKDIETMGIDYAIICEDDVCFHKSFPYMLKPVKCEMSHYDLLYIGYNNYNEDINGLINDNHSHVTLPVPSDRSFQPFYGTFGYICNSKFRKNIITKGIKWFINNNATIDYGFNIMTWEKEIQAGVVTGEQLVYPRIDDTEAINGIRKDKDVFYTKRKINVMNYWKPLKEEKKFVFIVPSYNNEMWIHNNVTSVLDQTYSNWRMIYINDCSTDSTEDKFHELTENYKEKVIYIKNDVKYGQAFNRYTAYNMCEDDEYCIMLDGDDWLASKYVLSYLNIFIQHYDLDMTYGTCAQYLKGKVDDVTWIPDDYSQDTIDNKSYRKDMWRAMHLRVMKAKYLKQVCPLDFIMNDNSFIICTTDMVESYPCLEMCKGRHKKITERLMIYNRENSLLYPTSFYHKDSKQNIKDIIFKKVKEIPPYQDVIQNKKVVIINIENEHYKEMIQHYKDNFVRTTDMFLVRNSLLHHYVNKLNKYEEISYISEQDIHVNTQKEEVVEEKKMDNDEKVEDIIKNDIVSNVEIKEPSSPVIIKVPKRRRRRQPKQTNELEVNAS